MYGFFNCALEDMIVTKYGEETWQKILRRSHVKLHGGSFLIHKVYPDDAINKLVQAASETLNESQDSLLETLGEHFLHYCLRRGYGKVLRVLGSNLSDFLSNLDNLHDHLTVSYSAMRAPSFRVTPGPMGSIHLHYYSQRKGLQAVVRGLVKTVAKELFETDVSIGTAKVLEQGERYHILMEISDNSLLKVTPNDYFRRGSGGSAKSSKRSSFASAYITDHLSKSPQALPISPATFEAALPFHVVFDRDMTIVQVGNSIRRLTKTMWKSGSETKKAVKFGDIFKIVRPMFDCSFDTILDYLNQVFVVSIHSKALETTRSHKQNVNMPQLRLKGQMISLPESDMLMFQCSPRVIDVEDMIRLGLYFSDFNIHDAAKDLILLSHYQRGERELVEKLDEANNHLKILKSKLRDDKRRTEELLLSIFPVRVAQGLLKDIPVEAELFPTISCLFSDIVGFTALCATVSPMDIIRMLNKLYILFDALTGVYEVYKVETIGDAYVVVAGVPEFVPDHADRLVALGLSMLSVTKQVPSPAKGHSIELRIGIHSGAAMSGIVGIQMPRYCLFGHTVTFASLIESRSLPSHVTISNTTKSYLTKDDYFFLLNQNTADIEETCYFVTAPVDYKLNLDDVLPSDLNTGGGHFRSPSSSPPRSMQSSPDEDPESSPITSPLAKELQCIETVSRQGSIRQLLRSNKKQPFDFPTMSELFNQNQSTEGDDTSTTCKEKRNSLTVFSLCPFSPRPPSSPNYSEHFREERNKLLESSVPSFEICCPSPAITRRPIKPVIESNEAKSPSPPSFLVPTFSVDSPTATESALDFWNDAPSRAELQHIATSSHEHVSHTSEPFEFSITLPQKCNQLPHSTLNSERDQTETKRNTPLKLSSQSEANMQTAPFLSGQSKTSSRTASCPPCTPVETVNLGVRTRSCYAFGQEMKPEIGLSSHARAATRPPSPFRNFFVLPHFNAARLRERLEKHFVSKLFCSKR